MHQLMLDKGNQFILIVVQQYEMHPIVQQIININKESINQILRNNNHDKYFVIISERSAYNHNP